ncbi:L-rhamnose-binding lectin CSL3 [Holothuria leucospilota]|uniref:L-rhamnose-binding lectin CSL3 n=1 Tax=Holothuria leucospilota TaxID=206669 RepID=A0A9Q1BU10_HOLLE|nr:L-rhamnose-binding lectin CSL3 [Holothuria leucospilota]
MGLRNRRVLIILFLLSFRELVETTGICKFARMFPSKARANVVHHGELNERKDTTVQPPSALTSNLDTVAAKFMVVCEGLTMNITCSGKENMTINDAMYGRLVEGSVACPDPYNRTNTTIYKVFHRGDSVSDPVASTWTREPVTGTWQNTNCQSDQTSKVGEMCDGKSMCSVEVRNSLFGDPCSGGTYKYLNVTYDCA